MVKLLSLKLLNKPCSLRDNVFNLNSKKHNMQIKTLNVGIKQGHSNVLRYSKNRNDKIFLRHKSNYTKQVLNL